MAINSRFVFYRLSYLDILEVSGQMIRSGKIKRRPNQDEIRRIADMVTDALPWYETTKIAIQDIVDQAQINSEGE